MTDNNLNINTEDNELIDAFINGKKSAFNFIIRKYQKKVYWIIRKMVLDHDDADDITQEVFLKLYRSLNDFRGESKFFTYVFKIAINYSLNHLAKNKKIINRSVNFEYTDLISHYKNADDEMDSKQLTILLEEAIETLPEQQRAVFIMRYYENLKYEEISGILNKSVGGMKANYFHALKKIENYLKGNKKFESLEIN